MWIVVVMVIIIFVVAISTMNENAETHEKAQKEQVNYIKNSNINVTIKYEYSNILKDTFFNYVVDEINKKIIIFEKNNNIINIPFNEIIGCEIITDSQVTGGIGRAVVGGLIGGDVGAVVGATTAKKHIMSYQIVIYRENIVSPQVVISLIKRKTSTKDNDYLQAVSFASNINASIKAIISKYNKR